MYDSLYLVVRVCPASTGVFRDLMTDDVLCPGLPREHGGFPVPMTYRTWASLFAPRARGFSGVWVGSRGVASGPRQVERGGFRALGLCISVHAQRANCTLRCGGWWTVKSRACLPIALPRMMTFMTEDVEVGHGRLACQDNHVYSAGPS